MMRQLELKFINLTPLSIGEEMRVETRGGPSCKYHSTRNDRFWELWFRPTALEKSPWLLMEETTIDSVRGGICATLWKFERKME
jgi:hypothetical protein